MSMRPVTGKEAQIIFLQTVPGYKILAEDTQSLPKTSSLKKMGDEAGKMMRSGLQKACHAGAVLKQAFETGVHKVPFFGAIVGRRIP